MSLSSIKKQQRLMDDLASALQQRLPASYTFLRADDSTGAKLIISQSATPTAGQQNWAIRIEGVSTAFVDSLGNPQAVYSPSRAQIIEEDSTIANVSLITLANSAAFNDEVARRGVNQERYLNANGTVPALSQFAADGSVTGSTLAASIAADAKWPLSGQ